MLIDYRFSNFRSFKEMTSLAMIAGRQTTLNDNLIREYDLRVVPSAVIYGANASGKSNIIMSLAVMKDIVLSGSLEANISNLKNLEFYPFAYQESQKPMNFEIDFIYGGRRLEFGFEVEVSTFKKETRRIVSEFLTYIDKSDQKTNIYKREKDKIQINKDKKALNIIEFDEKLLKQFEKKINENIDETELFLSRAFKSTISNELADMVLDFFKEKLVVVSDFTLKKTNLTFSLEDSPKKDFFAWNKILDGFVKNADFGPQGIVFKSNKSEDKESSSMELVSIYKYHDENIVIPAELMESRGTLKLVDFAIPFEKLFKSGGVFVLDEFDAAIHPELIKGILALFNDSDLNKTHAQLIFTTHNPIYLNNKIFRRDQIRFVEKDTESYESVIYSLADFGAEEVRNDHNYLINYFKGNYGALPFIDFSKLLNQNGSKEDEDGEV
ncbi:AAA family ATPase [Fusibacter tunisiensis]|uniref:AAA15 family ATPase/GTPase n=1 Tax=Fusibacter tunisiensis TaxID=1008308 RepID=A0ABS2MNI5_9FIRM|nr:ATP-binding protein [Fusibacter tunisiensis]MBM7560882.1 AAA15 family ATPase/GTPase [Fusibacter tunisiensis]